MKSAKKKASPSHVPSSAEPRPQLVRDSFTMPKNEYAALASLKLRAALLGHPTKKSELLRAGVACLLKLPDSRFLKVVQSVPSLKTGRPLAVLDTERSTQSTGKRTARAAAATGSGA